MALHNLSDLFACPEAHFVGGARPPIGLVPWDFGDLAKAHVGLDGGHESLDNPAVVRGEEHVEDVGRTDRYDLLVEVAPDDLRQLGEQDVRGRLAARTLNVIARQGTRQLERQLLEASSGPVGVEVDVFEFPRAEQAWPA